MKTEIKLGDKVLVSEYYKRVRKFVESDTKYGPTKLRMKIWDLLPMKEDTTGVVVGIRTVSNGRTDFDSEAGYMYSPKEFFQVLVVATSLYRQPILAPLPKNRN